MKTQKKEQTDKEVFLAFCKERGVKPVLHPHSKTIYRLPRSTAKVSYFGLDIVPDEITVYFKEDGSWMGGTNWLWDKRLPWIANKLKREKKGRRKRLQSFARETPSRGL